MNRALLGMLQNRQSLEEGSARAAKTVYVGEKTVLCRVLASIKLYVPADDLSLAPHLMLDGFWESWVTMFCTRIIKPGMVVVDAGANCGYFSLLFSMMAGKKGRVFALEPIRRLCDLIERSGSINEGGKLTILENAAWSESGAFVELEIPGLLMGGSSVRESSREKPIRSTHTAIETLAIDDLPTDRIDFVKMDIEGSEPQALVGMRKTFERCPDVRILAEYDPARPDHEGMPAFMSEFGFSTYVLGFDSRLSPVGAVGLPKSLGHLFFSRTSM